MRAIRLGIPRVFWWRHADARGRYGTDTVGRPAPGEKTLTMFNIGGNKYRLVARIRFDYGLINVRTVLTHDDYDRGTWKA